jgi:hypothetical protein
MAVLIAAPTSHIRMGRYGEPATPLQLVKLVFTFSTKFFRFSLTDFPLPHLVLIAMCGTLAYILHIPTKNKIPFKVYIILLCLIALITLTLIAAALSPSAYIEQGIPAKRARIIPRFIMIMGLAIGAWLSGYFLRQHYSKRWFYWLAVVIVGFSYIYALRTIVITADKVAIYRERAIIWDERDEIIRAASANGISEIDVRGIDGLPVGGIRDFKPKPGNWINGCASSYYGLKEIRATLP